MSKADSGQGLVGYRVSDAKYKSLGDCTLNDIYIQSFNGKVINILIQTVGLSNSQCLKLTLFKLFGRGNQSNSYIEKYLWDGDRCTVYYDENSINYSSLTMIDSKLLRKEYNKYLKEQTIKGAKDF